MQIQWWCHDMETLSAFLALWGKSIGHRWIWWSSDASLLQAWTCCCTAVEHRVYHALTSIWRHSNVRGSYSLHYDTTWYQCRNHIQKQWHSQNRHTHTHNQTNNDFHWLYTCMLMLVTHLSFLRRCLRTMRRNAITGHSYTYCLRCFLDCSWCNILLTWTPFY